MQEVAATGDRWADPAGRGRDARGLEAAARRMTELVDGRSVACMGRGRDQYDRIIATCRVANADIGATLVREGLAWVSALHPLARPASMSVGRAVVLR